MLGSVLSFLLLAAQPADVLLYLPFDGAVGVGTAASPALGYAPGRQGQAAHLSADLRLPAAGRLNPAQGTFAVWVSFDDAGELAEPRYLFGVYGAGGEGWHHSRFSLFASGGQMQFVVWDDDGRQTSLQAPVGDWSAGSWHHVAVTWAGLVGGDQGELALYLDGRLAASDSGVNRKVSQLGESLEIGRDGDASPDYTDGWLDELYLLNQAVPGEVIAAAAARPANEPDLPPGGGRTIAAPGWHQPGRTWRARVTIPAAEVARTDACFDLPLDFAAGAGQILNTAAELDPGSVVVVDAMGRILPWSLDGRGLALQWLGDISAGQPATALVYFDLLTYDLSVPLQARRIGRPAVGGGDLELPDYATTVYGDAWDFEEGDDEGIDQWGNAPEMIRHTVSDGALQLEVQGDPWFIWGNMWSQVADTQRPVDIDVARWRRLEMRVQQSIAVAKWTLYARPVGRTAESLIKHDFDVHGTAAQTVRFDLVGDAHWRGSLAALRIDPTNDVEARVTIDAVRLLAVSPAEPGEVETVGFGLGRPASFVVEAPARLAAGEGGTVRVLVRDAAGQPVAGQPVRMAGGAGTRLGRPRGDGRPTMLGLTAEDGAVTVEYRAATRIGDGPEQLIISLPFSGLEAKTSAIAVTPGEPAQIVFRPARPVILERGRTTAELTAQIADAYGNAVAASGREIVLSADQGSGIEPARASSGADGAVVARLTIDPRQRWVARARASAGALSGESPAVCITPDQRAPGVAMNEAGQFTLGGQPWLPLGGFYANWVAEVPAEGEAGRRNISFVDTDDAAKIAWLKHLADDGVTALRFMLRAHRSGGMEPMDIGGKVNPELYAEALRYLDLARPYGIRFLLVMHEDYTKPMYFNATNRERYCLPRWAGENLDALPAHQRRFVRDGKLLGSIDEKYTDADAIACQDQYARELVALFRHNPQVMGYELENEMVAVPAAWIRHACEVIREVDDVTPVIMSHGGGGLHTSDPQYWRTQSPVDFYTYHIYPQGTTNESMGYGRVTDGLTVYGRMAGRSFLGESVGDEWASGAPVEMRQRVARDVIWYSLVNANPGCMFWNHRGDETAEFAQARRISDELDLASWAVAKAEVAVLVNHPLEDDRYYRTAAGGADLAMMARYVEHYRHRGATFDFAWSRDGYHAATDLTAFVPLDAPAPVAPSAGWEAATRLRPGTNQGLCYLRNSAGVERWSGPEDRNFRIWFRTVKAAPATVRLNLGAADQQFSVHWVDLSTGEAGTKSVSGQGSLDLGTSDHDFVLHWRG